MAVGSRAIARSRPEPAAVDPDRTFRRPYRHDRSLHPARGNGQPSGRRRL